MKLVPYLIVLLVLLFGCTTKNDNFSITYNNKSFSVIVEKPAAQGKYPLVIYNHGGGYQTLEPFELNKVAKEIAKAGFEVWIPVRSLWRPETVLDNLNEAKAISDILLKKALSEPTIDQNNINIAGFCLGSWAILEENLNSPVRTLSLFGFGAPLDNTGLYDRVYMDANKSNIENATAGILIMVTKDDTRVDTEPAEILRERLAEFDKEVLAVEYDSGDHLSLAGNKTYLRDYIKYLKGEPINSSEKIQTNQNLLNNMEQMKTAGYW